jgi:hypothetical protein
MPAMHADFDMILGTVEIQSPSCYTITGQPRRLDDLLAPSDGSPLLPMVLESDLYARLYTRAGSSSGTGDPLAQRDFVAALSAANRCRGTWEPHWLIGEVDEDGRVAVSKDGLTFWARPSGLRPRADRVVPGEYCRVHIAKEIRGLMPGFYVAVGDTDDDDRRDDVEPLVRLYWHLTSDVAVPYMAAVTTHLNAAGVPFRAKVVNDPAAYQRADAGVVYLRRRHFDRAGNALGAIFESIRGGLRPEVPLFTKRLASGLGLAEDPCNGLSFGQHRCRLVAGALWFAFEKGETGRDARAAVLADWLGKAGLEPLHPYLDPGSTDTYSFGSPSDDESSASRWPTATPVTLARKAQTQ